MMLGDYNHRLSTSEPVDQENEKHFSPTATTPHLWQVCRIHLCGVCAFSPALFVSTHTPFSNLGWVRALIKTCRRLRSSPAPIRSDPSHVCRIWVMTCSTLGWELLLPEDTSYSSLLRIWHKPWRKLVNYKFLCTKLHGHSIDLLPKLVVLSFLWFALLNYILTKLLLLYTKA